MQQELRNLIQQGMEKSAENYLEAKRLSHGIDLLLGLQETQDSIDWAKEGHQTWSHISAQEFQTPYCEILQILRYLNPCSGATMVDLGAGYGRLNLVAGLFFPDLKVRGYELMPTRVEEGRRILSQLQLPVELRCADISAPDFKLPVANYYYIFDFGSKVAVQIVLEKLREAAKDRRFEVIGRGRGIRHWIAVDHPWLSQVVEPYHTPHWSVYKTAEDSCS